MTVMKTPISTSWISVCLGLGVYSCTNCWTYSLTLFPETEDDCNRPDPVVGGAEMVSDPCRNVSSQTGSSSKTLYPTIVEDWTHFGAVFCVQVKSLGSLLQPQFKFRNPEHCKLQPMLSFWFVVKSYPSKDNAVLMSEHDPQFAKLPSRLFAWIFHIVSSAMLPCTSPANYTQ